jgi:hypothetical protein
MTTPLVKTISGVTVGGNTQIVVPNVPNTTNLNNFVPGIAKGQRGYQVQGVVTPQTPNMITILNRSLKR